jgi:Zn-dependent protease with chaperone function
MPDVNFINTIISLISFLNLAYYAGRNEKYDNNYAYNANDANKCNCNTRSQMSFEAALCLPIASLIIAYYGKQLIGWLNSSSAIKCGEEHPLSKTVKEVLNSNPDFKNLTKVDVFLTSGSNINAFACGFSKNNTAVYVNNGLINHCEQGFSDPKLKGVIAHELGHIAKSHARTQALYTASYLCFNAWLIANENKLGVDYESNFRDIFSQKNSISKAGLILAAWLANNYISSRISRGCEYEADMAAHKSWFGNGIIEFILKHSNQDNHNNSLINGFTSLKDEFFSSHPSNVNRIINLDFAAKKDSVDNAQRVMGPKSYISSSMDSMKYSIGRAILENTSHFEKMSIINSIRPDYLKDNGYDEFTKNLRSSSIYDFTKNALVGKTAQIH